MVRLKYVESPPLPSPASRAVYPALTSLTAPHQVPLRIGFGVCMPLFSVEFYLDLCVDACFLLDIALCFRTAIFTIDKADETAQEQKLETDYKQIAKDYLKGW